MSPDKLYTFEQEARRLEEILKELGIFINHNYFRAEKGLHPFIHDPFGLGLSNKRLFFRFYYLVFTTDQLIILDTLDSTKPIDEHVIIIDYNDLEEFALKKYITNNYVKFSYKDETYYFYTKYESRLHTLMGENIYSMNYKLLKERNFMGLIK